MRFEVNRLTSLLTRVTFSVLMANSTAQNLRMGWHAHDQRLSLLRTTNLLTEYLAKSKSRKLEAKVCVRGTNRDCQMAPY